jgi:hypothetical protein
MAGAEEQQVEGNVAALEVAMVPGQDALGVVDMTTPNASLIEINQQLGPEVQKLQDREDGAAAEQQPQSGDVALAEQARHDVGGGEGGGVKHGAMEGKGGGEAVTADKSGKKEEKLGGCANDALACAQNSAAGPALPPDKGGCKEVTKENAGKEKKPDKGGGKVVTKENAGKKENPGGCADAALAGGQNYAAGPAPPPDKGGGKAVTKENADKKEKSGAAQTLRLMVGRTVLWGRRHRRTRAAAFFSHVD